MSADAPVSARPKPASGATPGSANVGPPIRPFRERERLKSYRDKANARRREWRADPANRAAENTQRNARLRERYATDADHRAARGADNAARKKRRKRERIDFLLERDGSLCRGCLLPLDDPHDGALTNVDHWFPVHGKRGGVLDGLWNARLLHAECNAGDCKADHWPIIETSAAYTGDVRYG